MCKPIENLITLGAYMQFQIYRNAIVLLHINGP